MTDCICTRVCDCQQPDDEDEDGIAYCSNECPEHNVRPQPHPECEADKHWWEGI